MNTNLLSTANAEALSRLAARALEEGVTPDEFRTKLVQEFTKDLLSQLIDLLQVKKKLVQDLLLVSPQRGSQLEDAFCEMDGLVLSLYFYLKRLQERPLDWPAKQ